MFDQVSQERFEDFKKIGAKFAVGVIQTRSMNSWDWAQEVHADNNLGPGLSKCYPGGDSWDNPSMCVAVFTDRVAAERCRDKYPKSEMREL